MQFGLPVTITALVIASSTHKDTSNGTRHLRQDYYDLLDRVRRTGEWEEWLAFFLDGVTQTAEGAVTTAQRLMSLFQDNEALIQQGGRAAGSALRIHQALKERPITSLQSVADRASLSYHTAASGMRTLEPLGVARELTGQRRGRLYGYQDYLAIMSEGTEPL